MAELLLQHGADINWIVDKTMWYTLLMQLCAEKMTMSEQEKKINYEIIHFLLENGASIDLLSKKNKTIFQLLEKHCNSA